MLLDFNTNVGREDILKSTIGNENLNEISNDNGVWVVNFATTKNLAAKSKMFPHSNIHKLYLDVPLTPQSHWTYSGRQAKAFKYTCCPIIQGSKMWYCSLSGGGKN